MASYKIIRRPQDGFQIDVVGDDGSRHSMLGFATEAEAQAWVAADQKRGWSAPDDEQEMS